MNMIIVAIGTEYRWGALAVLSSWEVKNDKVVLGNYLSAELHQFQKGGKIDKFLFLKNI